MTHSGFTVTPPPQCLRRRHGPIETAPSRLRRLHFLGGVVEHGAEVDLGRILRSQNGALKWLV